MTREGISLAKITFPAVNIGTLLFFTCFFSISCIGAESSEVWEVRGTISISRFGNAGEISSSGEHDFALASSGDGFRVRASTAWDSAASQSDRYNQGMLVVSDWKSLYQSNSISISREEKAKTFSTAKFESRAMPYFDSFGWGPMQALVLANYILSERNELFFEGQLRSEYVPSVIFSRGRDLGVPIIRTHCSQDASGTVTRILFWGVAQNDKDIVLSLESKECMLLGELAIEEYERRLPKKLTLVTFGTSDPSNATKTTPRSRAVFSGLLRKADSNVLSEISYDPKERSHVKDLRFPGPQKVSYTLNSGDPIPWDYRVDSENPNLAQRTFAAKAQHIAALGKKRVLVQATVGSSILALLIAFFVKRKTRNR